MIIHLSDATRRLTRRAAAEEVCTPSASLFGLALAEVYQAASVTRDAGRLLPCRFTLTLPFFQRSTALHQHADIVRQPSLKQAPLKKGESGLFSVALSLGHPRLPLAADLLYSVPTFLHPNTRAAITDSLWPIILKHMAI